MQKKPNEPVQIANTGSSVKKVIGIQDDPNSSFIIQWIKKFIPEEFQCLRVKHVGKGMFRSVTIGMTLPCNQFPLIVDEKGIAHPGLSSFHWLWSYIQEPKFKAQISKDVMKEAHEIMTQYLSEIEFLDPESFMQEKQVQQASQLPPQIPPQLSLSASQAPIARSALYVSNEPKTRHLAKARSQDFEIEDHGELAESDDEEGEAENSGSEEQSDDEDPKNNKPRKMTAQEWKNKLGDKKGRTMSEEMKRQNEEELMALKEHENLIKASEKSGSSKGPQKKASVPIIQAPLERKSTKKQTVFEESEEEVPVPKPKSKKKTIKLVPKKTALEWSKEKPRPRNNPISVN